MGRTPCCDKANVKRGPWSPEEDAKLKQYIDSNGTGGNWIALPHKVGLRRCGKSCRLRWLNYLRPDIKHGDFSDHEDWVISTLYANIGSRWSIISAQLPGRTDNDIKNYFNTKLKKKLTTSSLPPPPPLASYSTLNPPNFFSEPTSNFFTTLPHPENQINYLNNNVAQQQQFYQLAESSNNSEAASPSSSDASFINKTINGAIDHLDAIGTVLSEDYYLSSNHGMENLFGEGSYGLEEIKELIY